jgi:hypothetical protein
MMKITRRVVGVAAAVGGSVAVMAPALAEASFTSSMTHVYTGFDSRSWPDNNFDAAATTVRLDTCRVTTGQTFSNLVLQLTYENTWTPDENMGQKTFACYSTATGTWGRIKPGGYHVTLMKINGYTSYSPINVAYVRVAY